MIGCANGSKTDYKDKNYMENQADEFVSKIRVENSIRTINGIYKLHHDQRWGYYYVKPSTNRYSYQIYLGKDKGKDFWYIGMETSMCVDGKVFMQNETCFLHIYKHEVPKDNLSLPLSEWQCIPQTKNVTDKDRKYKYHRYQQNLPEIKKMNETDQSEEMANVSTSKDETVSQAYREKKRKRNKKEKKPVTYMKVLAEKNVSVRAQPENPIELRRKLKPSDVVSVVKEQIVDDIEWVMHHQASTTGFYQGWSEKKYFVPYNVDNDLYNMDSKNKCIKGEIISQWTTKNDYSDTQGSETRIKKYADEKIVQNENEGKFPSEIWVYDSTPDINGMYERNDHQHWGYYYVQKQCPVYQIYMCGTKKNHVWYIGKSMDTHFLHIYQHEVPSVYSSPPALEWKTVRRETPHEYKQMIPKIAEGTKITALLENTDEKTQAEKVFFSSNDLISK